jgi:hypothetical protein
MNWDVCTYRGGMLVIRHVTFGVDVTPDRLLITHNNVCRMKNKCSIHIWCRTVVATGNIPIIIVV